MRGAEALEAMRLGGQAPGVVMLETDTRPVCRFTKTWPALTPGVAMLQLTPGERVTPAALRCLVGLRVQVGGEDAAAVHATRDACIQAGAARVIASVYRSHALPSGEIFKHETVEISDTEGVLTWPQS